MAESAPPLPRAPCSRACAKPRAWDLAVIGGGATGLGVALDAAARGSRWCCWSRTTSPRAPRRAPPSWCTAACATWRRATSAWCARRCTSARALLANAPHVAQRLPFVMPGYHWWERGFYGAGPEGLRRAGRPPRPGRTEWLSARARGAAARRAPRRACGAACATGTASSTTRAGRAAGAHGAARGALVLNHCAVTGAAARARPGARLQVRTPRPAKLRSLPAAWSTPPACGSTPCATWTATPAARRAPAPMVAPSQGVHLVVDRASCPARTRCWCPRPPTAACCSPCPGWARPSWAPPTRRATTCRASPRPSPTRSTSSCARPAATWRARTRSAADVRSVWVGLRPLVKPPGDEGGDTKAISREHTVLVGRSGLVTVTGGKWTTYRAMAEDVLARCMAPACCRSGRRRDRRCRCWARRPAGRWRAAGRAPLRQRGRAAAQRCPAPSAGCGTTPKAAGRPQRGDGALRRAPRDGAHVEDVLARRSGCCSWTRRRRRAGRRGGGDPAPRNSGRPSMPPPGGRSRRWRPVRAAALKRAAAGAADSGSHRRVLDRAAVGPRDRPRSPACRPAPRPAPP
jgi:glycerol-3-phosphate dehydrogenase